MADKTANDKLRRKRAVALRYDEHKRGAPEIVASGAGHIAQTILEQAREAGVHIEENPELVELLARVPVGEEIPEELYQAVADILAFVYTVNERFKSKLDSAKKS